LDQFGVIMASQEDDDGAGDGGPTRERRNFPNYQRDEGKSGRS
jgi:hypothetical protein